MPSRDELKQKVCAAIDARRDRITQLGEAIMDAPELGFKETSTAARVKHVFDEAGLAYQDQLAITGVKAVLHGAKPGPTVALMGELDALLVADHPRADPATGAAHACGHNAQIAGLSGAALGLSAAGIAEHLAGNIVFFAVPAEEYVEIDYRVGLVRSGKTSFLCGKQELIKLGFFDDVDMAVMVHSMSPELLPGRAGLAESSNGFLAKNIRFLGRAAHAGVAPEQGINALNAATLALSAIHAQRETFRDEDCVRVHPIITKGGDLVNVVPAEVRMETYVRARTTSALLDAAAKVDRALRGAAMALGCTVEIETVPGDLPLRNDQMLARIFRENSIRLLGEEGFMHYPHNGGSTDAGDLSQIMPVLHPMMAGAKGNVHSRDWHIADPDCGYVAPAKTLAMMAIDLLAEDAAAAREVLRNFRPEFTKQQYLEQQQAVFKTEVFDGAAALG
ncbi:MAG: amidohydrolase [Bryobacteraceae bacterium]